MNRPFDDQTQTTIRLETEAIMSIFDLYELGRIEIYNSAIIEFEINKMQDFDKQGKVNILIQGISDKLSINEQIKNRGIELEKLGFRSIDALHISCAEFHNLDTFITTDKDIINIYQQYEDRIELSISNPISWIQEEDL